MVVCLDYLHGKVPHYLILNANSPKLVSMELTKAFSLALTCQQTNDVDLDFGLRLHNPSTI